MTNFEIEIERKLQELRMYNGKGNVKHSTNTIHDIIRLMMGMFGRNSANDGMIPVMPTKGSKVERLPTDEEVAMAPELKTDDASPNQTSREEDFYTNKPVDDKPPVDDDAKDTSDDETETHTGRGRKPSKK